MWSKHSSKYTYFKNERGLVYEDLDKRGFIVYNMYTHSNPTNQCLVWVGPRIRAYNSEWLPNPKGRVFF